MGDKGGDQEVTSRVQIPGFLRPFLETQANIGQQALLGLAARLSGAPASRFTTQPASAAQPSVASAARRGPIIHGPRGSEDREFVALPAPAPAPQGEPEPPIPGASAEDLIAPFTPAQRRALELGIARAGGAGGFIPTAQQEFLRTARGRGLDTFVPSSALNALMSTAEGDFLFGGQGFREAVDAAVRAAQPHILSTFGAAGRGTGGLAQTAIAQAATDAFARQHLQARQQQLAAAEALSGLGQAERVRQLQAARFLPSLAFTDTDALLRLGGIQQQQEQQELTAPLTALESLFGFSGGPVPLGSTLGRVTTQPVNRSPIAGLLGGAATGLGLGALTAPAEATGLAALGGPLGLGLGAGFGLLGLLA